MEHEGSMSRFWKTAFAVFAAGTVLGIAYDRILRPWHQHWGMTPDELNRSSPGAKGILLV